MPVQQSAVPFANELLALLDWNSYEIEVSLLNDELPEPKRMLSNEAHKALKVELAVVEECLGQKQYPWAIDAQKNALKLLEENLGLLNIETLECLRDLGNLYIWDKKYEEARTYFLRAWRTAHSVLPRKHEFLQSVEALYQGCMAEIEKSQHVINLNHHMAQIILATHETQNDAVLRRKVETPAELNASLKQAQEHLALNRYKEAEHLLLLSVKYLGGTTATALRAQLGAVLALWAIALSGLGQADSAHRTRLLSQKM